jgi:hypothetical protein
MAICAVIAVAHIGWHWLRRVQPDDRELVNEEDAFGFSHRIAFVFEFHILNDL